MSRRRYLFSFNRKSVQKVRRKVDSLLAREAGHASAPLPRYLVIPFPEVDGFPMNKLTGTIRQRLGHGGSFTEFSDQISMGLHNAIVQVNLGDVNEKGFDDRRKDRGHHSPMTENNANVRAEYHIECGERLRRTRYALDYGYRKLRRFAQLTGTNEDNLSNWERGEHMVPQWYIQNLKEIYGISHDWIYGNDASCMKADLALKILNVRIEE